MNRRFTIAGVAGVCMLLSACGGEPSAPATADKTPVAKEVTGIEAAPPETRAQAAEVPLPEPVMLKVNARVSCLAFSPDGKTLAVAGPRLGKPGAHPTEAVVKLLNPTTGREITTIRDPGMPIDPHSGRKVAWIKCVAFSPDGKTLAVATELGVKLWDVATAREVATLFGYGKPGTARTSCDTSCVAFSLGGKYVATSRRGAIELWDLTRQEVREVTGRTGGVAFSPDGNILATAEHLNRVHLWDVATGRQLAEVHADMGPLRAAAFSPDGKILAVAGEGGAKLYDVQKRPDGLVLNERPTRLSGGVQSNAFSPDGKMVATSGGQVVKLWDVATGRDLATPDRWARCAAFSPDGKTLAVIGVDRRSGHSTGVIRLWDVAAVLKPEVLAAQARKTAADLLEALKDRGTRAATDIEADIDARVISSAVSSLGPHSEAAAPLLIEALDDPSVNVRVTVVIALGRIGPKCEAVIPALCGALNDESSQVYQTAIRMLGLMGPDAQAAIDPLIAALAKAPRQNQNDIARTLGRIVRPDDGETLNRLREAVMRVRQRDNGPPTRRPEVARRDGKTLYDGRSVEEWIALLGWHYVPNEIFGRSSRQRPAEAIQAIGADQAVLAMIKALSDENWKMRVGAADGLGMFGADAKAAIPALVKALEDKYQQVRHLAAESLAVISNSIGAKPTTEMLKLLEHEDASVRLAAARALLGIDPDHKQAMGLLRDGLLLPVKRGSTDDDSDHALAVEAMGLLGRLGPRSAAAVPELVEVLRNDRAGHSGARRRRRAAETLGQIGPAAKAAIPAMIEALKDPQLDVRAAASRNLAKLNPDTVPEQLIELMDDPDPDCRRAAHWGLRHFREVGVAVLIDRLGHKDPKARIAALESLTCYPNNLEAYFAVVEKALEDNHPEVRLVAVQKVRLGSCPSAARALAALSKVAEDEDPRVREAAASAGRQIEGWRRSGRFSTVFEAMWNHHDTHGSFPPAALRDQQGKPLLSWRVGLLPYLGEQALYDQFHHDEPWDSPHNLKLLERIPEVFRDIGREKDGKTMLMVFVGEGTPLGEKQGIRLADFTDDPRTTIMVAEAGPDKAVPWTKPEDLPFDPTDPVAALGDVPEQGFRVIFFAAPSARTIPKDIDAETLKALITHRGGEKTDFLEAAQRRRQQGPPGAKPPEPKPPVPFKLTPAPTPRTPGPDAEQERIGGQLSTLDSGERI